MTTTTTAPTAQTPRWRDITALCLLPLTTAVSHGAPLIGFLLLLGALALLWQSKTWSVGEKLAATFVLPSSLVFVVLWTVIAFNNTSRSCVSNDGRVTCATHDPGFGWGFALAALVLAIVASAVVWRLVGRLRSRPQPRASGAVQ